MHVFTSRLILKTHYMKNNKTDIQLDVCDCAADFKLNIIMVIMHMGVTHPSKSIMD